jgi:hypothetical protein
MAMAQDNRLEIDRIRDSVRCEKGFPCCNVGVALAGKVKVIAGGKLLDCLEADVAECGFALPFGDGFFCRCPLRKHIAQTFHV